jgi:hypothetical protein
VEVASEPLSVYLDGWDPKDVFLRMDLAHNGSISHNGSMSHNGSIPSTTGGASGSKSNGSKSNGTAAAPVVFSSYYFLTTLGNASLPISTLSTTVSPATDSVMRPNGFVSNTAKVTVTADRAAVFVLLETSHTHPHLSGKFSENAFALLPGETKEVIFSARMPFELDDLRGAIQARSLRDTY